MINDYEAAWKNKKRCSNNNTDVANGTGFIVPVYYENKNYGFILKIKYIICLQSFLYSQALQALPCFTNS